ncbi:MAG: M55 family metallopeptidase [bacterium]|nr:M55 family metallopeptidase [bacterium]
MKIYIITDLEGVAGVVNWDSHQERATEWMTAEIQAAVDGARSGGAEEIIVAESHKVIIDKLDKDVKLVLSGGVASYLPGLDESVDGVFIVGQHARAGVGTGVLNHTGNSAVFNTYLNGIAVGELGFEMAYAGSKGVPVVLLTGDTEATQEAKVLVDNMETVAVKEGINKYQTISLHPRRACELIREGAKRAVERINEIKPFTLEAPYDYKVEFTTTQTVSKMCLIPGVRKVDERSITYTSDNFQEIANMNLLRAYLYDAE